MRCNSDFACDIADGQLADVSAKKVNGASRGAGESEHQVDQARFARARWPGERDELALPDGDVHAFQKLLLALYDIGVLDATDFVRSSVDVLARFTALDWQLQKLETLAQREVVAAQIGQGPSEVSERDCQCHDVGGNHDEIACPKC